MIDDDDATFTILGWPWAGWLIPLGIFVVIAVAVTAMWNREDCEARKCDAGQRPKLMKGECLCVTPATKESK